jgi:hypothetical protein
MGGVLPWLLLVLDEIEDLTSQPLAHLFGLHALGVEIAKNCPGEGAVNESGSDTCSISSVGRFAGLAVCLPLPIHIE